MAIISISDAYFRPQMTVPQSGVYRALHDGHRPPHDLLLVRGDEFPSCRSCQDRVRFVLAEKVGHAGEDGDLQPPSAAAQL